jgi:hypothetical protein
MFHSAKGISLAGGCQYGKAGGDVTIWRQFSSQASASICWTLGPDSRALYARRRPQQQEVAAWCDCTVQIVRTMEHKALTKLRRALKKIKFSEL